MSTQHTNPNRVPAGVKTGGQFSTSAQGEPEVALTGAEPGPVDTAIQNHLHEFRDILHDHDTDNYVIDTEIIDSCFDRGSTHVRISHAGRGITVSFVAGTDGGTKDHVVTQDWELSDDEKVPDFPYTFDSATVVVRPGEDIALAIEHAQQLAQRQQFLNCSINAPSQRRAVERARTGTGWNDFAIHARAVRSDNLESGNPVFEVSRANGSKRTVITTDSSGEPVRAEINSDHGVLTIEDEKNLLRVSDSVGREIMSSVDGRWGSTGDESHAYLVSTLRDSLTRK